MKPWTVLGSERVIDDPPWLVLRRDDVVRNGSQSHYWVLEQPAWVNVIAVTEHDQLVLVRQHRHGIGRTSLELPGGYGERVEDPLDDAKRELREETGYGGGAWSLLQKLSPNPALQTNWMYTYLATDVAKLGEPQPDANEDLETQLVPADSILRLVNDGEIFHALHVAPLLVYAARR